MNKNYFLRYQSKLKSKVRNNNCTAGNFSTHYKLIAKDLNKQSELENGDLKQQINFIRRLEQNATIFFIIEKEEETIFNFSQNSMTIV